MENLEELRFNMSKEMNNMFIEIIIIRQLLRENDVTDEEERKLLKHELIYLTNHFITEFNKNNVEELKLYNEFMN